MKPAITNIIFHGEDTVEGRSVTVVLDDGHSVTITPLTSIGQKTFHQGGATMDRLRATVALAQACVPWLHGDGPRPALRRFLSKASGEKAAEYRAARSADVEAPPCEVVLVKAAPQNGARAEKEDCIRKQVISIMENLGGTVAIPENIDEILDWIRNI